MQSAALLCIGVGVYRPCGQGNTIRCLGVGVYRPCGKDHTSSVGLALLVTKVIDAAGLSSGVPAPSGIREAVAGTGRPCKEEAFDAGVCILVAVLTA